MKRNVAKPRRAAKSARITIRRQKIKNVTEIGPAMLKMRDILRFDVSAKDAAFRLSAVLMRPHQSCHKLLNGTLALNADGLMTLLQSRDYGAQVYDAVMDAAPHAPWYVERRKDFNVLALSKEVAAQSRKVAAALQDRIG